MREHETAGSLAEVSLLLAVFFVGTDFVAVKLALSAGMPPLILVALRYTLAGLLLLGLASLLEPNDVAGRRDLLPLLGLGLVGITMNQIGYTVGLSMTNGSNAALVFATAPVWGLLLGATLRQEHATKRQILGTGLALLGVGLVVYEGLGLSGGTLPGDLLVLVSAASWGGYTVLSLPVLKRHPPLTVAAYTMLFGGLAVLPLASTSLFGTNWGVVGAGAWAAVAYSTLFASAFAIAAWQLGAARLGANRTLVYMYLLTLVGVAASVLLLGDDLGLLKLLGAAIILAGVYLARRR